MLRRIFAIDDFRGLSVELMPDDTAFGKETIIFGPNGSGKSSISEFLRLAVSRTGTESVFRSQGPEVGSTAKSWSKGQKFDCADIRVFNHFYVQDSLQGFLDADGQSATIFKLGDNALAAKAEPRAREIAGRNQSRLDAAKNELSGTGRRIDELEKKLKQDVVNTLGPIDSQKFSSYRFNISKARNYLAEVAQSSLSESDLTHKLETARMAAPKVIPVVSERESPVLSLRNELNTALEETTSAIVINELAENPALAAWVEAGLKIHENAQHCNFCLRPISAERIQQLKDHFNESRTRAIQRLRILSADCDTKLSDLQAWQGTFPSVDSFYPELREEASEALESLTAWAQEVASQIIELNSAAILKIADFHSSVICPEAKATINSQLGKLNDVIDKHNKQSEKHSAVVDSNIEDILFHLAGRYSQDYRTDKGREPRLELLVNLLSESVEKHERQADHHRAEQTNIAFMADQIDSDVRIMFGRSDLQITPSADKNGYVVRRHNKPARFLSEGERKMIALSYFVRSLESDDAEPEKMVVVIDDPVSSLDRENMYAVFSWLQTALNKFSQSIILTHDFELLRLYISGTTNQRSASEKKIKDGNKDEIWFPKVKFLEVFRDANSQNHQRVIQLRNFPEFLLRHDSEYHYLFHKVVATARSDGDENLLPLVGNASRRLLEGFASFEAPGGSSFQEKLDTACKGKVDDAAKNRVIKFAHGQSHRDNPNPATGVDLPNVRTEIQALLDLISACNTTHFERMCKATNTARDWSVHIHPIVT